MSLGRPDILIVDDDLSMSQAIERLLSAAGWKSLSFASAEDLLDSETCAGTPILILDLQLPGMSGLELFRRLATERVPPSVIFITGQDRPDIREVALREGAVAYLTKPFAGVELIRVIRQHLDAA